MSKLKYDDKGKVTTRESSTIEFKESFHKITKYAKTMAAFANNKGGCVIFGVKDKPRKLIWLLNNDFEQLDEAEITQFLNSHFSPEIKFKKYISNEAGKTIGFLEIEESKDKPIVCIKQHNHGGISEAEIYYRYNSQTEKIKYPELVKLFNVIRQNERNEWQNILKKIAKTDTENITILNSNTSQGNGIHITDDPNAMPVKIDDKSKQDFYCMDYKSLVYELRKRYKKFVLNKRFHKIKEKLITNANLCYINYLDHRNKKGSHKVYYSKNILKEFDKHYTKE